MNEAQFRVKVVGLLRPWHAIAVENRVCAGTPDVNFSKGWIELKVLSAYGQPSKPVVIHHFTPQQRVWLMKRSRAGEKTFLFLHVVAQNEFILLDGYAAALHLNKLTRCQLHEKALGVWNKFAKEEIIRCLTS
jgi:hypothetical protein